MCSGVSQPEGKKLLRSLVVWRWILLYPLPDGSRVNRPWLGECCLMYTLVSVQYLKIVQHQKEQQLL